MDSDYHLNYQTVSVGESEDFVHAKPDCNGKLIDNEVEGERLCSSCGAVQTGVHQSIELTDNAHKRPFGKESHFTMSKKDAFGSNIKPQSERLVFTERLVNRDNHHPPSFQKGLPLIDQIGSKLRLTDAIIEEAREQFNLVIEQKLSAHRSIRVMASAVLYLSARKNGVHRSYKEVSSVGDVTKKSLAHGVRLLNKALDYEVKLANPEKVVSRFSDNCNFSEQIKREALELLRRYREMDVPIGNPNTLSATLLRIALRNSGEKYLATDIEKATGVSLVTIRYREQKIRAALKI